LISDWIQNKNKQKQLIRQTVPIAQFCIHGYTKNMPVFEREGVYIASNYDKM
jgi:hypothetical protein